MPDKSHVVGLLTDFGLRDHFVGVMKAVMESVCPGVRSIDITHEVESHNVSQAAYLLWASYRNFPTGAVIAAIVDPGVGGSREIIAVKTKKHILLAPNNGLLDLVLWEEKVREVTMIRIEKAATRQILARTISSTFHGRDIFAPLAAHLVQGTRLGSLGAKAHINWIQAPFVKKEQPVRGAKVLHVDRFGNVVTNIRKDVPGVQSRLLTIKAGKRRVQTWGTNYESIVPGKASLIVGSSGLVEIVMNQRSAAAFLKVEQGDALDIDCEEQQ